MRRPGLNHDHVAGYKTGSICPAPRICSTPEDDSSVIVRWIAKDFVEDNGKSVQMTNMQWAEVCMEGIVQQGVVDCEVDWLGSRGFYGSWTSCSSGRLFLWRFASLCGIREGSIFVRGVRV